MEIKTNWGQIRTSSEQYTLKIRKILEAASLGSNFTGRYKKRVFNDHLEVCITMTISAVI